jgi:hypothetical protein
MSGLRIVVNSVKKRIPHTIYSSVSCVHVSNGVYEANPTRYGLDGPGIESRWW